MSKPRYSWWGYVKSMVRRYPYLAREYSDLKELSSSEEGARSKNKISRPTENLALRELPKTAQREYEAVRRAVETVKTYKTGKEQLQIIDLVYWKKTHSLSGAALKVGFSYDRAKQLHTQFLRLVAKYYGLLDE